MGRPRGGREPAGADADRGSRDTRTRSLTGGHEGDPGLASSGLVSVPYSAEQSPVPPTVSPLGQLVTQTGGTVIAAADPDALVGHRYPLRGLLTWIGLALFLVGVAVRMWPGAGGGGRRGGRPAVRSGRGPGGSSVDQPA